MTPKYVIMHHSLTSDGQVVDWIAIRRYHTSWRYQGVIITEADARKMIGQGVRGVEPPWADIGYHAGIEVVNGAYQILMGRMWDVPGAHCPEKGMNGMSLGFCCIGNYDLGPPPDLQWKLAVRLTRYACSIYKIPKENVYGHGEWSHTKTCPGTQFDMSKFRNSL
jgi:N-acetylmuramoyl-L-alanine amidase